MDYRDALLKAMTATAELKPRAVVVPEWGTVYVREVTVEEVEDQTEAARKKPDPSVNGEEAKKRNIARGAAAMLCDATGKRLFDQNNPEHLSFLGKQPWSLLQKIVQEDDKSGTTDEGN
jgi:hypothetical protein